MSRIGKIAIKEDLIGAQVSRGQVASTLVRGIGARPGADPIDCGSHVLIRPKKSRKPCSMKAAAILSVSSPRRLRDRSASWISTRSTAAVERRSSQKVMGRSMIGSRLRS